MPIKYEPPRPADVSLRDKIVNTISEVGVAIVNKISEPIKTGLHNFFVWINDTVDDVTYAVFGPLIDWYLALPDLDDALKAPVQKAVERHRQRGFAILPFLIGFLIPIAIGFFMNTYGRLLSMKFMRWARPARPSYRDATQAYQRGYADVDIMKDNLLDMGFPDNIMDYLIKNARVVPFWTLLQELYHRGQLTEAEALEELKHLGYDDPTCRKIFDIFPTLPSVADMITMLAREAFEPEMIAHYGLGDEYPGLFTGLMAKLGYDEEWAKRHWYKHWDTPSLTQVYDMLHRGVIEHKDVWDFFRLVEISPFWREKLIKIQYRLPTRVDIRRMYRDGHLTRDQVKDLYQKIGYDEANAELLTRLAVTFYKDADRDLTKTDIVNAYSKLGTSRSEALDLLIDLGYEADEAEYYLDYADYKREQERVADAEKLYHLQYTRGVIDIDEANRRLGELGKETAEISLLIQKWTTEKETKVQRPTVTQLLDFYARRIVAGPELEAQLSAAGYSPQHIAWYVESIEQKIAEENERKEAAELRREMSLHKYPTRSDLARWYETGIIRRDEFMDRMTDLGYSEETTTLFIDEISARMAGKPRFPSRADLARWYETGVIPRGMFIDRMAELGYSRADIDRYLEEIEAKLKGE